MSLRKSIPAGLFDAGFASLGTFAVGLVAVRLLEPAVLGAYALFMSAFRLISVIPAQLILVPAQIEVLSLPPRRRVALVVRGIRLALVPAAVAALLIPLTSLLTPQIDHSDLFALAITAAISVFLSPLQDHVRRVLHLSDRSSSAAVVSVVQFTVAGVAIAVLWLLGVPAPWIPFAALAIANAASLSVGVAIATRQDAGGPLPGDYSFRNLVGTGGWLAVAGMTITGSAFAASAIVNLIVGPAILGYAEAARVVAQPLNVLALGVGFVINPRSMTAAHERDKAAARRISRIFSSMILAVGALYLLVAGLHVSFNPVRALLPNAFLVPWLVAAAIGANIVRGLNRPFRAELVGVKQGKLIVRGEAISDGAPILIALTAPLTEAFAIPLGQAAAGVVSFMLYRGYANRIYSTIRPHDGTPWNEESRYTHDP